MSDELSPEGPERTEIAERVEAVVVRRSPRYGVFLLLGAGLGVFVAMILTFAFGGSNESETNAIVYSDAQVFGFLALICVAVGLFVGGMVAIILEWTVGRRLRQLTADHTSVRQPE